MGQLLSCPLLEFTDRINQVGSPPLCTHRGKVVQAQGLFAKL